MMRQANPMTTMPVPPLMSAVRWYWPTMPPDRAVRALAMHRPTVMVKVGFTEEARTMSRLSPVARMDRPSRVPRKSTNSTAMRMVTPPASTVSYHFPPMPVVRNREKMVSSFNRLTLELQPITMRFTVYNPVLVTMPAKMEGTPRRVCKKAVTNPAQAPATMAAGMAKKGWPAAVTVTDTAAPSTKAPSVVRSAMSRMR